MNHTSKFAILISILLVSTSLLNNNEDVFALSCPPNWDALNEETVDAIFNGTVVSKKFESNTVGGTKVDFQVDQSFKGRIHGLVNINAGDFPWYGRDTIGDPFHVGKNYFVVAEQRNGNLFVGNDGCYFSSHAFSVDHWNQIDLPITTLEPEILPPKHQTSNNVSDEEIICNEGLQLIFKISDNSPACVKPETKTELIERGWAQDVQNYPENTEIISEYSNLPTNFEECANRGGYVSNTPSYVPGEGERCLFEVDSEQDPELYNQCTNAGGGLTVMEGSPPSYGCKIYYYESGSKCFGNFCD